MRVGQKNGLVYQWAKKGSRPRQPKDQRYENAYLFGAVCPGRNTGIAVIMPHADTEAMQKHVDEISLAVAPGAHALIILDKAAWHTTRKLKLPDNLTLVPLPPACPELNAAENIWQYRVFKFSSRPSCSRYAGDRETRLRLLCAPLPGSSTSMVATSWSRLGAFRTRPELDLRKPALNWTGAATFVSMADWRRVRQPYGRWGNALAAHNSRT